MICGEEVQRTLCRSVCGKVSQKVMCLIYLLYTTSRKENSLPCGWVMWRLRDACDLDTLCKSL
jgi:hypothetical protein